VIDTVISLAHGTSTITGHPDRPIENVRISNLQMFMEPENTPDKRTTSAGSRGGRGSPPARRLSSCSCSKAAHPPLTLGMPRATIRHLDSLDDSSRRTRSLMSADRTKRTSDLFHAALARPQEQRAAFLIQACGSDEALREEVESLLRFDGQSPSFLESPAAALAGPSPVRRTLGMLIA
jgi:hypothetical protein